MGYEARKDTGAHALVCDTQGCPSELIAPSQADLVQDALEAGWEATPALGRCTCSNCLRGLNLGEAALKRIFGGVAEVQVLAHANVHQGDACVQDVQGRKSVIGTYKSNAISGTPVMVTIGVPKPQARERMSRQLAEVLQVPYVVYQQPDLPRSVGMVQDPFDVEPPALALPSGDKPKRTGYEKIVVPELPTDLFGFSSDDKGNN